MAYPYLRPHELLPYDLQKLVGKPYNNLLRAVNKDFKIFANLKKFEQPGMSVVIQSFDRTGVLLVQNLYTNQISVDFYSYDDTKCEAILGLSADAKVQNLVLEYCWPHDRAKFTCKQLELACLSAAEHGDLDYLSTRLHNYRLPSLILLATLREQTDLLKCLVDCKTIDADAALIVALDNNLLNAIAVLAKLAPSDRLERIREWIPFYEGGSWIRSHKREIISAILETRYKI